MREGLKGLATGDGDAAASAGPRSGGPGDVLRPLKLLLPALVPSWNFFDVIAASPRIEYGLLGSPDDEVGAWREFRPRPERVSWPAMLGRLLWNARWNETLFVVSCAERLMVQPTAHSEREIFRRIAADLADGPDAAAGEPWLRFRLVFLSDASPSEGDGAVGREVWYVSAPRRRAAIPVR